MSTANVKRSKKRVPAGEVKRRGRSPLWAALGLAAVTFLIYLPAIRGEFIWDDPDYIVNNPTLRTLDGLWRMWTVPQSLPQWYPLVHTTFWIEFQLWQLNPIGYHIDNVLLHIGSALLLWRLLIRLEIPAAFLAAAIFAVHPVAAESVAWATERKNVLSLFFYLLTLLAYLRYLDDPKRKGWYAAALLLFLCALLSKTVVATLPAAVLVILWWKRGEIARIEVLRLIPFFVLGIGLGLFTAYLETHHVGASGDTFPELRFSPLDRLLIAGRAVWFYAWKLVVPYPLVFIYPRWTIDPRAVWQWAFPAAFFAAILALWLLRKRIGRGPLAAALLFAGTLFPALGFFNIYPMRYSFVADHFQYHASIALIVLIAAGVAKYARRYAVAALLPLAVLTAMRTPAYSDAQTIWEDTVSRNPNSWMAHMNLAHAYQLQAQQGAGAMARSMAERHYLRSAELTDNFETNTYAGYVFDQRGDFEAAVERFDRAIALNPRYPAAYYGKGQVYDRQGQLERALAEYARAIELKPGYPQAHYRAGRIYERQNQPLLAAEHYRAAVNSSPEDPDYRYNLGTALLAGGRAEAAAAELQVAVQLRRDWPEAWTNLGAALLKLGRRGEAASAFRTALSIRPGFPPASAGLMQAGQP